MSNNVVIFTPKFENDAIKNLDSFYAFVARLVPLNKDMDRKSDYWKRAVNFTKMGIGCQSRRAEDLLSPKIRLFAKQYILYCQTLNRTKNINEIKAIRAIDAVMTRKAECPSILDVNNHVFDQAAEVIRSFYSGAAAYHGGSHLEKLHDFLVDKKLIRSIGWKNPIPRASDVKEKVGREAAEYRARKLPDENALLAIGEIFSLDDQQLSARDIFTTSCVTIMLAAPARASELFCLPVDCIHEERDSENNLCIGLRWFGAKGYGHEIEWIPDSMAPFVKKAIKRLRDLTSESREAASRLVADGVDSYVKYKKGPSVKIKWQDALFCMFGHHLSSSSIKPIQKKELWMPTINTLGEDLKVSNKGSKLNKRLQLSVFERHNYPSQYELRTHQIRHLNSSLASVNGMPSELHAKWASRADKKQNRTYNHTPPEQYREQHRKLRELNSAPAPQKLSYEVSDPSTIYELNVGSNQTAHHTDYGMCWLNMMSHACTRFKMCIGCTFHSCQKGDKSCIDRIEEYKRREIKLLTIEKDAIDRGVVGAERHHKSRTEQIQYCDELLNIHNNEDIPDGSEIRLAQIDARSALDNHLEKNYKKRIPKIEKTAPKWVK